MHSRLESEPAPLVTVAVVQFTPHADIAANTTALAAGVREAAERGAQVVVGPEYAMFAVGRLDERIVRAAQPLDGRFVTDLRELAARHGVFLLAGMAETSEFADRVRNTIVVVDPDGAPVHTYRKVHLYDAFGQCESDIVVPGDATEVGIVDMYGLKFGVQTCFDLRFPEGFRRLAVAGAQVLVVPAQWIPGPDKRDHWQTLLRARAIENTAYVVGADQCGPRSSGQSLVIDPLGEVVAALGEEPAVAVATLEAAVCTRARQANPSLNLRRFAVVPTESG